MTENKTNINWFPGHMARARRILAENLSLVDVVVELCDARIPYSSRNPEITRILGTKPSVLVCNKADLADPVQSEFWRNYYRQQNINALFTDCRKGDGVKRVIDGIMQVMQEKIQREAAKGRKNPQIRAMIVGIPNVGKSSFINRVAGKAAAVTGDKPGVTRNKQWLKMNSSICLLDTPGLLWPKIEDQRCAYRLACTGAIKDDILENTDIASFLLDFLRENYGPALEARFKLSGTAELNGAPVDVALPQAENRMVYEFARFRDAIVQHDTAFFDRMAEQSARVAAVLEQAHRTA